MPPAARRATALPPEERRQALIAATLPLVLASGTEVSTRQIAEAAGVAEGTIFRAFATKGELIDAVVEHAFDPSPLLDRLREVRAPAALRDRLVAVVELLQDRVAQISSLLHAIGHPRADGGGTGPLRRRLPHEDRLDDAVAAVLEPDRDRLRCAPHEAARRLRLVTLALSHPRFSGGAPLPAAEIVSLLLDGMQVRAGDGSATLSPTPTPIGASSC